MIRALRLFAAILSTAILLSCSQKAEKPLIGVTAGYSRTSAPMMKDAIAYGGPSSVSGTYLESVLQAGGLPVILPTIRSEKEAREILSHLDGIVISGGEDVDPIRYNETILEDGGVDINFPRDTSDFIYSEVAAKDGKPILAICRGMQLLNVALGGSLYQDLPSQKPSSVAHRQPESARIPTHPIGISKGTFLSDILLGISKGDSLLVNTKHHQAVKDLAGGLDAVAWASDGIVEAYCNSPSSSYPFIIGVQFHPEALVEGGRREYLPIFREFVKECSR